MLLEKECEICGIIFQPTRSTQKYCEDCRKHPEQKRKEYDRALKRSIREYGTGYEEPVFFDTECKNCGKTFQNNKFQNLKFCSDDCEHKWILEHTCCSNCGRPATEEDVLPKEFTLTWYCSKDCRQEARLKMKRAQGKTHPCPVCGKEVADPRVYCSVECYEKTRPKAKKYPYTCAYCGKQGYSNSPKIFCSQECYVAARQSGWQSPQKEENKKTQENRKKYYASLAQKKAKEKQKKYIMKNGLCGICKTPYPDCIRMTSQFREMPEGAKSPDGKIIISCPNYTKVTRKK